MYSIVREVVDTVRQRYLNSLIKLSKMEQERSSASVVPAGPVQCNVAADTILLHELAYV